MTGFDPPLSEKNEPPDTVFLWKTDLPHKKEEYCVTIKNTLPSPDIPKLRFC
jgi:hypothetical protein